MYNLVMYDKILEIPTPEKSEKEETAPVLYVYSKQYGETTATLKPGFDKVPEKVEGKYNLEVPPEVLDIYREVLHLGGSALLVGGCVRDMVISTEFPELAS